MKFGQTPWDTMPREQLLREVQRMFSALVAARGVLIQARLGDGSSLFWRKNVDGWGSGGKALTKVEQSLKPYLDEDGTDDSTYRAFFRYADDLLFDDVGSNWMICGHGDMIGSYNGQRHETCPICKYTGRGVVPVRPITWDDLRPHPPLDGGTL